MSLPPVSPQPKYTKRPWRPEEDNKLREMIERLGIPEISGGKGSVKTGGVQWTDIAKEIPGRVAKQCRERWRNNLDPSVSRAPWTEEENEILLKRYDHYGSSWAEIASGLPGRPDNGCKNQWNKLMGKGRERERPRATKTKPKAAAKPKKPKAKAKTAKAPPKAAAKVPAKKVPKDRPGQEPDHEPPEPPEPPEDVDSDVGALTGNAALQTSPMGSRGLVSSAARHYLEEEELEHPSLAADLAEDSDEYSDDEQPELDKPSSGMDMRLEPLAAPRVRDGQRRSESGDPFAFARDALDSLDGGWSDGGQAVAGVSVSAVQNDALRALERFADIAFQPPPRIEPDGAATEPVQIERVPAGQKRPRAESKTESDREVCGSPAVSPVEGEASEGGEKTADAQPHAKRRKDGPPLDVPPAPPPSPSAFRRLSASPRSSHSIGAAAVSAAC